MVYLIGAGPGDKDYITVKGLRFIEKCDVIIYDRLANRELLASTKPTCEKIYVGKKSGFHSMHQEEINRVLVEKGKESDQIVVRLKGGDPFVFGRGGEEILALEEHHIPYEVISGVTSAISVPASAGIPLTHRELSRSIHIITGHTATTQNELTQDYEHLSKVEGTLVFLMGLSNIEKITAQLIQCGKNPNTPAAVVSKGTTSHQVCVRATLDTIADKVRNEKVVSPAIIVVGDVAAIDFSCQQIREKKKLHVGITGTASFVKRCMTKLEENHFTPLDMGCMKLQMAQEAVWQQVFDRMPESTWLAFTSANGVHLFFDECSRRHFDIRKLSHLKVAVIGFGTKEVLEKYGIYADFCPDVFTAEDMADQLCEQLTQKDRVLLPRAVKGSKKINEIFAKKKKMLYDIPIYDVVADEKMWENKREELVFLDCLIFGSVSGVDGFFAMANEKEIRSLSDMQVLAIGKTTADALLKKGVENVEIAKQCCIDGLIESLMERMA